MTQPLPPNVARPEPPRRTAAPAPPPPTAYQDAPKTQHRLDPRLVTLRTMRGARYVVGHHGVATIRQVLHPLSGGLMYHLVTFADRRPTRIVYDGVEAEIGQPESRKA